MADGSRILSGPIRPVRLPAQFAAPGGGSTDGLQAAELSLHDLVSDVRRVFGLTHLIGDEAILSSLMEVSGKSGQRARWLALFNSPLGVALAKAHCDLSTALGAVLAALPPPRS